MDVRRQSAAVAAEYTARLAAREQSVAALDAAHDRLAWARLGTAAVLAAMAVAAFGGRGLHPGWLALPVAGFATLAIVHARVLARHEQALRAVAFYRRGLDRLGDQWQAGTPPARTGLAYAPPDHPYADDLDLFGPGSLFALLSGPRTGGGEARLAAWLLAPAPPAVVMARQVAVADLGARLDLREALAVDGPDLQRAADPGALVTWATATPLMGSRAAAAVLVAVSAASLGQMAWWFQVGEPPALLSLTLFVHGALGLAYRSRVRSVIQDVEDRAHDLALLAALLTRVEAETFRAPHLVQQHARLTASGRPASADIRHLARLADLIASRQNALFGPPSVLLFWATHLAFAVEAWRARAGRHVAEWLDALAEVEAVAALGTYAAEHPDDPFPTLVEGPAQLTARQLAHPLLPREVAVANDVSLGSEPPALLLVSGSNMAGKSTLLRAIGINVVLAQAGAPVRAQSLTLTPLAVGATLRIQDSLQAGRSRFFAEITRVRQVVALAQASRDTGAPAVLFLLDELLAGTNSHDRRHGAEAILRGLIDLGAIGLATTHDLALTALADALAPRAANVHLEDHFVDGHLTFDYRLRPGVVQGSNALALMRSVGLDV